MKFLIISFLLLIILVFYTSAQNCFGGLRNPSCRGEINIGHRGAACIPRQRWAYNPRIRQCQQFLHLGCGGNQNRWCTQTECNQKCRRNVG